MLGSGLTACEVALHLNNTGHDMAIVGRRESVCFHENFTHGPSALYNPIPTFLDWFDERGIALYNNCDAVEILPNSVRVRDTVTGEERQIACGTVILASGMKAKTELAYKFQNCAPYVTLAGDCIQPHKIRDAVSTGYWAAMEI